MSAVPEFESRREYKGITFSLCVDRDFLEKIGMTHTEFFDLAGLFAKKTARRIYDTLMALRETDDLP